MTKYKFFIDENVTEILTNDIPKNMTKNPEQFEVIFLGSMEQWKAIKKSENIGDIPYIKCKDGGIVTRL